MSPVLRMRITIALNMSLLALPALADRRSFIRSYEYATQPQGNLEVELWNDIEAPKAEGFDAAATTHRFELEYGLTDHWDLALYHVFAQEAGVFRFDSWRAETRYRFAEKGEWPVDVLIYFELERPAEFAAPWETEEKVILGKDFGPIGLVANLVAEQKFLHAGDGHSLEVDLGARYELTPQLTLAAEFWRVQEWAAGGSKTSYFLGPSISVATSKIWVQLGVGFGLGDNETSAQVRSVLGFNL
jgi:hypothetical protein